MRGAVKCGFLLLYKLKDVFHRNKVLNYTGAGLGPVRPNSLTGNAVDNSPLRISVGDVEMKSLRSMNPSSVYPIFTKHGSSPVITHVLPISS